MAVLNLHGYTSHGYQLHLYLRVRCHTIPAVLLWQESRAITLAETALVTCVLQQTFVLLRVACDVTPCVWDMCMLIHISHKVQKG